MTQKMEEMLLKSSIELYNKHVWNYEHLAILYLKQKRYLEVNDLIKKTLGNIKKIYTDKTLDEYRSANVDDFLDCIIKGSCITATCVEIIREKLIPKHVIFFLYNNYTLFECLPFCEKSNLAFNEF